MSIVIEGHDATGKSSLALYLINILGIKSWRVVESEGPAQSRLEIHSRINKYFYMPSQTLFVRHPCVSNPIYDVMRQAEDKPVHLIDKEYINRFYDEGHTFIYCDPGDKRHEHKPREGEDPDHLASIERRYDLILEQYRAWAVRHAHHIYRIGDDPLITLKAVL